MWLRGPLIMLVLAGAGFASSHSSHVKVFHDWSHFEPNHGQINNTQVLYTANLIGPVAQFTNCSVILLPRIQVSFMAHDQTCGARIVPEERSAAFSNYYIGNTYHAQVPYFHRIRLRDVIHEVDVVFYFVSGALEFDVVARHTSAIENLRLRVSGSPKPVLSPAGLFLENGHGRIVIRRPRAFAIRGGTRVEIPAVLKQVAKNEFRFAVEGQNSPDSPLVIDPTIVFSTYFGGTHFDQPFAVSTDTQGDFYVTGSTTSPDFPTFNSVQPFQGQTGTTQFNAFVTKLNPTGSSVLFSTFLGGSTGNGSSGMSVAADNAGAIYVAGTTDQSDFPTTPGAFQTASRGGTCNSAPCSHGFASKLDPKAGTLLYSTYLSGSNADQALGVSVDSSGRAVIVGKTSSPDFPVSPSAIQPAFAGGSNDAFILKLNETGSNLVFSTFLGGGGLDSASAVSLDPAGNILVVGNTGSGGFPLKNPILPTKPGPGSGFVAELDGSGMQLLFSTFFGGSQSDFVRHVVAKATNEVYIAGSTTSPDFPVTPNALQRTFGGGANGLGDAFLAKLDPTSSSVGFASYIGGSSGEQSKGLGVDAAGNAYVFFDTNSPNLPTKNAFQSSLPGGGFFHTYLAEIDTSGSSLQFGTYFGGTRGEDSANSLAADACGNTYLAGGTNSSDFPLVNPLRSQPGPNGSLSLVKIGSATQDFGIFPTTTATTVKLGQSTTIPLRLTSCNGFQGQVALSCSVQKGSCSISPNALNLNGDVAAMLSYMAPATVAQLEIGKAVVALCLAFTGVLAFPGCWRRKALAGAALTIIAFTFSCGGGSHPIPSPSPMPSPSSSTTAISITASGGAATHSVSVQVTLQ